MKPRTSSLAAVFERRRFEPALEAQFQASLDEQRRTSTQISLVMAVVLYIAFIPVDLFAMPNTAPQAIAIRTLVVVPILLAFLRFTRSPAFIRHYPFGVMSIYWLMGLSLEALVLLADAEEVGGIAYWSGLLLVTTALYVWTYLRPWQAAVTGFGIVAVYVAIDLAEHLFLPGAPSFDDAWFALLFASAGICISANVIGLVGMMIREAHLRDVFLLQRRAEDLAEAKSAFLANMSHEIRTPLNGVLGLAQMGYRDAAVGGDAHTTFGRILDSGRLLLTVIDDILDFSKIEAGKLEVESIAYSPARLVEDAVAGIEPLARGKGLKISGQTSGLPAACLGDPVRISQILFNLLSNAVKFTPGGAVGVRAFVDGDLLVYEVHDTGIGIAAQDLSRIFLAFEQVDGRTTRRFGGTGLGLSISRRLAELMGGSLTVDSTPGHGSRFGLRLPLRPTTEPLPGDASESAPGTRRLAGLRILVAEDNAVNQLVIEDMLVTQGADVTLAGDGRRAVEAFEQAQVPFDLVLMDLQMPEMDGFEATRALLSAHPGLVIIGQTAHALPEEHEKCRRAGMAATLTKPLDTEKVVAAILAHAGRTASD